MSVLIKGKALPKDCGSCDLCDNDGYCYALYGDSLWDALPDGAEYFPDGWKYAGCPLVEVPEPYGEHLCEDEVVSCLEGADWINEVIRIFLDLQAEGSEDG